MKGWVFASLFIICFSSLSFAQEEKQHCPEMSLTSSKDQAFIGETIFLQAIVSPSDNKYKVIWKSKQDVLFSGQETSLISFTIPENLNTRGIKIEATIKGLPKSCDNKIFKYLEILKLPENNFPFMKYEELTLKEEYRKFDYLFVALQNRPRTKAYVLFESENSEKTSTLRKRISQINNVIEQRNFDPSRIIFGTCRSEKKQTSIWVVKEDAEIPKSAKCEKIDIKLN